MQPTTGVDENELQKAINNITSAGGAANEQAAVQAVGDKVAAENPMQGGEVAAPAPEAPVVSSIAEDPKAAYGDPDLGAVKASALADLRPIIDKVDLSPEAKFKIYREIILSTNDKAAIEPAYNAARNIAIEKDKAEALLFVVETIDNLGIGVS